MIQTDGTPVRFAWKLGAVSGGKACLNNFVLFGKETDHPTLPLPLVTAFPNNPMRIQFAYRVLDDLYVLEGGEIGFAASPNPDYARDLNPSEIWAQKKSRSSLI